MDARARVQDLDAGRRRTLVAWALGLYALVAVMAPFAWHDHGAGPSDRLDRWARAWFGPDLTRLLRGLHALRPVDDLIARSAGLGEPRAVGTVALLLGLVCLARRDGRGFVLCGVGPVVAGALTEYTLKPFVGRLRDGSYQYPSGHCTGAAAIGALGLFVVWRHGGRRRAVRWAAVCAVPPILVFVAVQRLRWHDLTEAIAGLAVGAATIVLLAVALTARPGVRAVRPASEVAAAR